MHDIIVVGGGPAGLMAAGFASANGYNAIIIDKNKRPARKLMITGKGRCNLTNNCEPCDFLRAVRTNPRFLYSAINTFTPRNTMDFFEALGVPLKTERGGRVFPQSDRAVDIVDALARFSSRAKYFQGRCNSLVIADGRATGITLENGEALHAKAVLLATGGMSYPLTGSTGDGYELARQAGHEIVPPQPSLVAIITNEAWPGDLAGLSLKNVSLTLSENRKSPVFSASGELLFTHNGISGPLALSASSHMDAARLGGYKILIDLKPAISGDTLDARLLRDFSKYKNKNASNALYDLLPRKLIPIVLSLCGIESDTKINQITKERRSKLSSALKGLALTAKGFAPIAEAIITSGGIDVKEIDPASMRSKVLDGLFFAGELIDVDAYTGGYNLQIAFSTGYAAAMGFGRHDARPGRS